MNLTSNLSSQLTRLGEKYSEIVIKSQGKTPFTAKSQNDFVTETDVLIEELFREWLKTHYPTHKVIGEEGEKTRLSTEDIIWYVDPIDGTSNFIDGNPNVTMHFGCIHQGKPLASLVVAPFFKNIFVTVGEIVYLNGQPLSPPIQDHALTIGTEYLEHRTKEDNNFETILHHTQAKGLRIKSIGMNLLSLLEGKSDVFYKPATKFWDVIAPLILIHYHRPDIAIEIHYSPLPNTTIVTSPFSNESDFLKFLNKKHTEDCRIGLIVVYPKNKPELKNFLMETISA